MKRIKLTNSKKKATVDDEDYAFINQFKWRLRFDGYVVADIDGREVEMGWLVMTRKLAQNN